MALHQKNRQKVTDAIRNRQEFHIASMSGELVKEHQTALETGRLPDFLRDQLNAHLRDKDVYVVYSYSTPIGWAYDREFFIPDVQYSATTKHHQSVLQVAAS
jgi:hypothetical protein